MSNYRRANTTGASYFFTLVAYRRQHILCDDAIRNALRTAIARTRAERPFGINAWVQLPSLALHLDVTGRRCGLLYSLEHDQTPGESGLP